MYLLFILPKNTIKYIHGTEVAALMFLIYPQFLIKKKKKKTLKKAQHRKKTKYLD